jgi:hypothetical protein
MFILGLALLLDCMSAHLEPAAATTTPEGRSALAFDIYGRGYS